MCIQCPVLPRNSNNQGLDGRQMCRTGARKKICWVLRVSGSVKNQNQAGTAVHGADVKSCLDVGSLGALSLSHC